ncbi:dermonecrotic toxin domain-containing protein [Aliivibrio salmonicida]|uniref:dermonecrotic toxin domain-containing protein n=1 Tax=Aliivibrio salmonicida TaxID=40269 RepID=UPI003D12A35E
MKSKAIKTLLLIVIFAAFYISFQVKANVEPIDQVPSHRFDTAWRLHFVRDYAELMKTIPDPLAVTSKELKTALTKHGYSNIDPDTIFYNEFRGAMSSSRSYNGWAHHETPSKSYTVTQAVMLNVFNEFRDSFPDTINLDTGIYTEGAEGVMFDERNEVRLLSSALWDITYSDLDIQTSYTAELTRFWANNSERYTQLMRDSFAFSAHQQYQLGLLEQDNYQLVLTLLKPARPANIHVYRFDIYGYDATDMLLIEQAGQSGGVLYIPGSEQPFVAYRTERQLKKTMYKRLQDPANKKALLNHFSLYLRQDGTTYSGVDSALTQLVNGNWNDRYFMMKHHPVTGNVFARMTELRKARMSSDGDTMIKSNAESQRDYILSIANSLVILFPVVDILIPELGIPLTLSLSSTQFGLSLDKAVNGDSLSERLTGTRMSAVNAAVLGTATILPVMVKYGQSLALSAEKEISLLPNRVLLNEGVSAHTLNDFTSMPRIVIHPQTGEELLGLQLTESGRSTLLRADGFGYFREIDPLSGRLINDSRVVRALNIENNEPQWLERGGLRGGNSGSGDIETNEISSDYTPNHSQQSEILLPEDLPEPQGIGGSGYADMTGGRDLEAYELEQQVNPYGYLSDTKALHRLSTEAQKEIQNLPFYRGYQSELNGSRVFRGDTRLPDEIFHSGFNRRIEPVEYVQLAHHTRGIRGVISTSTEQSVAVNYALDSQRGYVYAIELNHGGKTVDTLLRDESLNEIATLNIPPEDIMFAVGPFNSVNSSYREVVENAAYRTAEVRINPHSTASTEAAEQAFERLKSTLKYELSSGMSFADRYANRSDLLWYEDEMLENTLNNELSLSVNH